MATTSSIVGCGPSPNPCSPCFDSFKFLRGGPCFNISNPSQNNIWWATIVQPVQGTPTDNAINTVTFSSASPHPICPGTGEEVNAWIGDSTNMVIFNQINQTASALTQLQAFELLNTCEFGQQTTSNPCATTIQGCNSASVACTANGIVQFLALISISPSCTFAGTGLTVTLSPLRSNALYTNVTYGNWCPFSFSIGNCNTQSVCASLILFTSPVTTAIEGLCTGFTYNAQYANFRLTLLDKCKRAQGSTKKAHYLAIESLNKSVYLVFFGQLRSIGSFKIIVISPIVDLRCIIFQAGFIIVTPTPLSLNCSTIVN